MVQSWSLMQLQVSFISGFWLNVFRGADHMFFPVTSDYSVLVILSSSDGFPSWVLVAPTFQV